jgi:CTP synthase
MKITDDTREKIGLMCDVEDEAIVNCVDVPSIYDIPLMIMDSSLIPYIVRTLGLDVIKQPTLNVEFLQKWKDLKSDVREELDTVEIALVGKYTSLHDSYLSVVEALKAAGFANKLGVKIRWVDADLCETQSSASVALKGVDGVLIPGGFGARGVLGKIGAIEYARENKVPLLGICLGLQCMVIEYARNVLGLADATSTEFEQPGTPVIATMEQQVQIVQGAGDMGGTMRLGSYDAALKLGSLAGELYGTTRVSERHRHRYEVDNQYVSALESAGLTVSGTSLGRTDALNNEDNQNALGLVEFVELDRAVHPYFIATQAHPEFKSRPTAAHPLFNGLIKAAFENRKEEVLDG